MAINTYRSTHNCRKDTNERDPRSLWAEWLAVPQIVIYTGTALDYTKAILADLEVFPERMLANLHTHKDLVASEWLLFRLGTKIGKMQAQEVLHAASQRALEKGRSLIEVLRADSEWGGLFQEEDFAMAAAPEGYVGLSGEIVDAVVGASRPDR